MPDVTLIVQDLSGAEDAERLERAIGRLSFVEAGHDYEPSPGAEHATD